MKKKYTSSEILDMAVKKAAANYYADLDKNGTVDIDDARIALRREKGLDSGAGQTSSGGTDKTGTTFSSSGAGSSGGADGPASGAGAFGGYDGSENSLIKKELLDSVISDTGKGYDFSADKIYADYKKEYEKSADRAARNVYGNAASGTGGYGSSYAASAAASAYSQYLSQLAEKMPEFAESAASVRKTELQNKLNALDAVRKDDSESYSRYTDAVKNAWTAAENGDYSYLEALGVNTDAMREEKAFAEAAELAKYGDYSGLKYMGADTAAAEYAELLSIAAKIAEQGDYSFLEAIGVDVSGLREKDKLEKAIALAKYGDYSLLGGFSTNAGAMKEKINFTVQRGASAAYSAGGYRGLISYLNSQVNYGQITENGKKQIIKALTGN